MAMTHRAAAAGTSSLRMSTLNTELGDLPPPSLTTETVMSVPLSEPEPEPEPEGRAMPVGVSSHLSYNDVPLVTSFISAPSQPTEPTETELEAERRRHELRDQRGRFAPAPGLGSRQRTRPAPELPPPVPGAREADALPVSEPTPELTVLRPASQPELPATPVRTVPEVTMTGWQRFVRSRDWVLFALVSVLELIELATTKTGLSKALPEALLAWHLDWVGAFGVFLMLWVQLTGFASSHAPVRKWLSIGVFATLMIYFSFFTYYLGMTEAETLQSEDARAQSAYAAVVSQLYQPAAAEALRAEATETQRLADAETQRGCSAPPCYGPEARALQRQADALAGQAAKAESTVSRLGAALRSADQSPEGLYQAALHAWRESPPSLRANVPAPELGDYVVNTGEAEFLLPIVSLAAGDHRGYVALAFAAGIGGMALLLGTAIEKRRKASGLERLTRTGTQLVREWRTAYASWREAITRDGEPLWVGRHQEDE